MVANFIGLFCNLSDLKFNLLISASELYPRKKNHHSPLRKPASIIFIKKKHLWRH